MTHTSPSAMPQAVGHARIGAVVEERDAAQRALADAEAELAAFLDEARRAGVPPGWLRTAEPRKDVAGTASGERAVRSLGDRPRPKGLGIALSPTRRDHSYAP